MMPLTTVSTLPPDLRQYFDRALLQRPLPGDKDTDLWDIWKYIEAKVWKKLEKTPGKKKICEELKRQFMELYEQIKTQKENPKTETKNKAEMPMYYIGFARRSSRRLFGRLKYRARRLASKGR
jgi:hypothetical protein